MISKRNLLYFLFVIPAVIIFSFYAGLIPVRQFPTLENPKKIILNCEFQGQELVIEETLYQSVRDYYRNDPKKKGYSTRNEYQYFITEAEEDKTLKKITGKIKEKAIMLDLNSDRTLDLATCFVQNIPYDEAKAKKVLSTEKQFFSSADFEEMQGRFPYETLYDNQGICTDKSFLEAALARELGFGVSLLTFDLERHMAAGVKVPIEYSSFNTGYALVETTNTGYRVGQLPIIDDNRGQVRDPSIVKATDEFIPEIIQSNLSKPSQVITVSEGKSYDRIVYLSQIEKKLSEIIIELNAQNYQLEILKNELINQEEVVDNKREELILEKERLKEKELQYQINPTQENYQIYSNYYNQYSSLFYNFKALSDSYNLKVDFYNQKIVTFNANIDEYNNLIKID